MITCAEIVYSLTQTEVCLCDFADCESPRLHTGVWRRLLSPLPFCVTDRQDQLHQPKRKDKTFILTDIPPAPFESVSFSVSQATRSAPEVLWWHLCGFTYVHLVLGPVNKSIYFHASISMVALCTWKAQNSPSSSLPQISNWWLKLNYLALQNASC